MHRFFCESKNISGGQAVVADAGQLHHIRDVLRFKAGETAVILDEDGAVYNVKLLEIAADKAVFGIVEKKAGLPAAHAAITVACALPKKSKIDDIIDKLTQIGVDRIIPMTTERVVVRLDRFAAAAKARRWQKIALSAVKQSQRSTIPVIDPMTGFDEVIRLPGFDARLIPHLAEERASLKSVLHKKHYRTILVLIGPEGDFTPTEISRALAQGFIPVSLGDNILRVETAALVAAGIVQYELQEECPKQNPYDTGS
ncbi:MAG: RsmE family RNA methyltransferase [Candidatus Omnitrophica bacterium]|nr:RsmE family RNA methyltransferase [Candidatus Omnitrophota bacterium]